MFSLCKKEGFEFSHSPEHAFTSGAIYCLKAKMFWASPHSDSKSSAVSADGAVKTSTKYVAEKRAEIFGANFITEYVLYSHPFSVSPTSGLFFTAPFSA